MIIKKFIKYIIIKFTILIVKLFEKFSLYNLLRRELAKYNSNKIEKISINRNKNLFFFVPNDLTQFRANTFFTKEPDTLNWIDSFKKNSVFWDVGSNIGLYSCYAAKKKKLRCFCF